jgi:hypothetical protein
VVAEDASIPTGRLSRCLRVTRRLRVTSIPQRCAPQGKCMSEVLVPAQTQAQFHRHPSAVRHPRAVADDRERVDVAIPGNLNVAGAIVRRRGPNGVNAITRVPSDDASLGREPDGLGRIRWVVSGSPRRRRIANATMRSHCEARLNVIGAGSP